MKIHEHEFGDLNAFRVFAMTKVCEAFLIKVIIHRVHNDFIMKM